MGNLHNAILIDSQQKELLLNLKQPLAMSTKYQLFVAILTAHHLVKPALPGPLVFLITTLLMGALRATPAEPTSTAKRNFT